ncbi:Imm50 family immunity protein [Streptomyces sp. NBC_01304]|uniref:Imm50 family immunity protein n=1 Tax=Streptomyces sp. NBC_01304 TaxID=2903818 RepID=UPI003FA34470
MAESNWVDLLDSPGDLANLYGLPPSLDSADLFYVHIDERGRSVTLGFDTRELPSPLPPDWASKGLNSIEFYLTFNDVAGLLVRGWEAPGVKMVSLMPSGGWGIVVSATSEGSRMEFSASSATVSGLRAYLC